MKSIKSVLSGISLLSLIACGDGVQFNEVDITTIEPISKPVLIIETPTATPEPVIVQPEPIATIITPEPTVETPVIAITQPDIIDIRKICSVKPSKVLCNNL